MFKDKKILALIPARGGSKGIPYKNIMNISGKPLIAYSIESAKKSKYIDYVLVSTDDEKIKNVSMQYGGKVPFIRPSNISGDVSKSIDVVIHGLNFLKDEGEEFDYVILLQPTSPLRTVDEIDKAIEILLNSKEKSLVSVCKVDENPVIMRTIDNNKLKPIVNFNGDNLRRQNLPEFYIFNGAIYINSTSMIMEEKTFVNDDTIPFIMKQEDSIDIDNMIDAKLAQLILKEKSYD